MKAAVKYATQEELEAVLKTIEKLTIRVEVLQHDVHQLTKQLGDFIEATEERFDRIYERFDRIDERFDRIDERFDRLEQRFDRLEQKVDSQYEKLLTAILQTRASPG